MILYVLGPPGVGKTTLVRSLLGPVELVQKPKWSVGDLHVAAGHYVGGAFDGADTVGYSQARVTLEYWAAELRPLLEAGSVTFLDGDRFSSAPSLGWLRERGERVSGVLLSASPEELAARRLERGSKQNEAWMRGRETKARRFAETIGAAEVPRGSSAEVEGWVRGFIHRSI